MPQEQDLALEASQQRLSAALAQQQDDLDCQAADLSSCQSKVSAQAAAAAQVAVAVHQLEHRAAVAEGRLQQLQGQVEGQAAAAKAAEEQWKVG